jgi:hypothetical protein
MSNGKNIASRMAPRAEGMFLGGFPMDTQPSTAAAAEKEFALFERSEFANSRQRREAPLRA